MTRKQKQQKTVWLARPEVWKTSTGDHRVRAIARIARRGDPLPNKLTFILSGKPYGPYTADPETGAVTRGFTVKPGRHTLWAQVPGTDLVSETFSFSVPEEEKKPARRPARVVTSEVKTPDGKHVVSYQVLTDENDPVPGAKIRVMDPTEPKGLRDLRITNARGITEDTVELADGERERHLTYSVLGSGVYGWKRILR